MFEVLDVSISLHAGEEKEYFMSCMAFFHRVNSVKLSLEFLFKCMRPLVDAVKCQVSVHIFKFLCDMGEARHVPGVRR